MTEEEYPRWEISESLRRKMVEVARHFRKMPTPSEAVLWNELRGKKLEGIKFRRQQPVGPFIVDFYAPACRLILEVDGPIHETQKTADRERQEHLEMLDLRFVRLSADLVEQNLPAALASIRVAIAESPPHPPAPSHTGGEGE